MKTYTVVSGDTLFAIARQEYGDGTLFPLIVAANHLQNPDFIQVGQQLQVPYVTRRHRLTVADSGVTRKQITQTYYGTNDQQTQLMWEVANGVAQRPIDQGSWLLLPDLAGAGHHTVAENETLPILAQRWYGDEGLATVISAANHLDVFALPPGQVLLQPGLNRRHRVGGQTLHEICESNYGPGMVDTWMAIVTAANRLDDPSTIVSGQVLQMPS